MAATQFDIAVGSLTAKSNDDQSKWYLTSLSTDLGIGGVGHGTLHVASQGAALPKIGDEVTIKVDATQIFAGHVLGFETTENEIVVHAADGLAKLAKLEVQGVYENKTAGAITKEILQKAGLQPGTVEDGPKFSQYILRRGPRAMRHIEDLAARAGFSLFADPRGKIHFAAPKTESADHTLEFAVHVLTAQLRAEAPALDSVVVWGEGAGEKGDDKEHWLTTKLSGLTGKAAIDDKLAVKANQEGKYPRTVHDGTVRTSADAKAQAKARMTVLASRLLHGFIETLGNAKVEPGQSIKIDKIPDKHPLHALAADKVLHVRRVQQAFSARRGFVTRMEF